MRSDDLYKLPDGIPVPEDDGAADHLKGAKIPSVPLAATDGSTVDLSALPGRVLVYAYPRTGRPDQDPLVPEWNAIPGARGCTPQSCSFRDHHAELQSLRTAVYGLSTQDTAYQQEMVERLHLPFPVLSDEGLALTRAMNLPTFEAAGLTLLRRLTWIARDGIIEKVFYPVFPPDRNADEVMVWLLAHPS